MENNQQKTLQFVLGEETRPKVDLRDNGITSIAIKHSIFYKQYSLAVTSIAASARSAIGF